MSSTISYNGSTITTLNDGRTATLSTATKYVPYNLVITDTTDVSDALAAIADKGVTVPSGAGRSDLATLIGQIYQGSGSAITITDEADPAGGTHRIISAVELGSDTVTAATLGSGITAHDKFGNAITGTATIAPPSTTLDWMGKNPTYVNLVYAQKTFLKDTAFKTWTPSSTATAIIASADGTTTALDLSTYEYWLIWSWEYTAALKSGATTKAQIERQYGQTFTQIYRRPYGRASFATMTDDRNYATAIYTSTSYTLYWNTSGSQTWTTSLSYGIYGANTNPTVSSNTATSVNLTPKSPAINARCNSNYFSTARAAEVDQDLSTIIIRGDLYRVDAGSGAGSQMWRTTTDIYNHPLTTT